MAVFARSCCLAKCTIVLKFATMARVLHALSGAKDLAKDANMAVALLAIKVALLIVQRVTAKKLSRFSVNAKRRVKIVVVAQ